MNEELKIFNNYIKKYDLNIKQLNGKVEHTYRVVEYAEKIAKSLNLNEDDINLAKICALFHDLGRFPQYAFYNTFQDSESIDHGDESYKILKELNYDNDIVLKSVKYHNKYKIPDDITEREKLFCNITRDADKLDIMFTQGNDLTGNYKLDEKLMYFFNNYLLVDNKYEKNPVTDILRQLAFIFDINFKESFKIIRKSNIINYKIRLLFNSTMDNRIYDIEKIINTFIDERIDKDVRQKI